MCIVQLSRVWVSSQNEGLRHVTESGFRCLGLDCVSSTIVTLLDPCSKGKQELLLDGFVQVGEVRVTMCVGKKFKPAVPVLGQGLDHPLLQRQPLASQRQDH
jgi:hypothetical protein